MKVLGSLTATLLAVSPASGQVTDHIRYREIVTPNMPALVDGALFGSSVAFLGDLDKDGGYDIAVGAPGENDDHGAVFILFLTANHTIKTYTRIDGFEGGNDFDGRETFAGFSLAALGDLDLDGVPDLVVGAPFDDGHGPYHERFDTGAIWVLFMNTDGTTKSRQKIDEVDGNLNLSLTTGDHFGISVDCIGDLDGDGIPDLVVGSSGAGGCGTATSPGAVYAIMMNRDGTVKTLGPRITDRCSGGLPKGHLSSGDRFGYAVASLGDLDNDGTPDVAVSAVTDDGQANASGSLWILFLNIDGSVKSSRNIKDQASGLYEVLLETDLIGSNLCGIGDLGGDGIPDLAVGIPNKQPFPVKGEVWLLHLNRDGTVKTTQKLGDNLGGFMGALWRDDKFGYGIERFPDTNADGFDELFVGAPGWDQNDTEDGEIWLLLLDQQAAQATAVYKEAGLNPSSYRVSGEYAGTPVMGSTVTMTLDVESTGHRRGTIIGYLAPASTNLGAPYRNLLVDTAHPAGEFFGFPIKPAPVSYTFDVPNDPSLCGTTIYSQGVHLHERLALGSVKEPDRADALDGCALSNAVDFAICDPGPGELPVR